jgi:hypothetical protein
LFIFILKIKQKSGIPLLSYYTFPESFNKICLRKWLWALMGLKKGLMFIERYKLYSEIQKIII